MSSFLKKPKHYQAFSPTLGYSLPLETVKKWLIGASDLLPPLRFLSLRFFSSSLLPSNRSKHSSKPYSLPLTYFRLFLLEANLSSPPSPSSAPRHRLPSLPGAPRLQDDQLLQCQRDQVQVRLQAQGSSRGGVHGGSKASFARVVAGRRSMIAPLSHIFFSCFFFDYKSGASFSPSFPSCSSRNQGSSDEFSSRPSPLEAQGRSALSNPTRASISFPTNRQPLPSFSLPHHSHAFYHPISKRRSSARPRASRSTNDLRSLAFALSRSQWDEDA